jgi:phosphatidylserine decarboxylase
MNTNKKKLELKPFKIRKFTRTKFRSRPPTLRRRRERIKGEIWIYNEGIYEQEQICAERWMRLIYENPASGPPLMFLAKRKMLSRLYGMYCRTPMSARGISKFIEKYQVDMTGCQGPYRNFADFFAREKQGVQFPKENKVLGSPCEGLVSVHTDIQPENLIAAKGSDFSLSELFNDEALAREYKGGTMVQIRLTPANYHRMHFFDDGLITHSEMLNGDLYSVSPLAINRVMKLYCRNKRAIIKFASQNFGDVVLVEVGATFVGSIVHCFKNGEAVSRGQQASYFLPGGSLVLAFFKGGTLNPDELLVKQTTAGYETKMRIGSRLGGF